ncbi:MAG: sle [Acidimicrobiales bacterium]|nr:sle [Acidimicrobiales bacterium]
MHDLVIRRGTVVDGTGAPPFVADVAVDEGRITAVGRVAERGREELDAADRLVTPGFVDPHTHYDGQATWDPRVTPSIWHGVTTVVMGNCGVGFAPVTPDRREFLIQLMEGVEDIPGSALAEGIRWDWETVPEYLDALDQFPRAIDVAAQVTHGSVRAHVMGERGAANEPATEDDISRMAAIVGEGVAAGAVGFSTNRLPLHTAVDGRPVPGTYAGVAELSAMAAAVRAVPGASAILQAITAGSIGGEDAWPSEIELLAGLSRASGLRCTFTFGQGRTDPEQWRELLGLVEHHNATGAQLVPQVACQPLGILVGLRTRNPWTGRPGYDEIGHLPVEEQARHLADPDRKARILAETVPGHTALTGWLESRPESLFPLQDPADHEPAAERSIGALAQAAGRRPSEYLYDVLLEDRGERLLHFMLDGYAYANLDHTFELLQRPDVLLGLGDGGAHVSLLCDATYPTVMLAHWARDRQGPRLPVEHVVRKLTLEPASLFGLRDRGTVRPGAKADLNVVDFDRVAVRPPEILHDLPAGAPRLIQRAVGYDATVVAGEVVERDGEDTGARPGRLVRGAAAGSRPMR